MEPVLALEMDTVPALTLATGGASSDAAFGGGAPAAPEEVGALLGLPLATAAVPLAPPRTLMLVVPCHCAAAALALLLALVAAAAALCARPRPPSTTIVHVDDAAAVRADQKMEAV